MKSQSVITVIFAMVVSSCYYDNEALLYGAQSCDTTHVTYALTIAPILNSNCLQCHSQAASNGGIVLEGYSNVKSHVDNGKLIGAISHANGFSPMPKNAPQLSTCDIEKIKNWISNGTINN
jgi:mono/diheme cytochrome c family protein